MRSAPFVFVLSLLCIGVIPVWADPLMDLEQHQETQIEKNAILSSMAVDVDPLGPVHIGQQVYIHPELNRVVVHPRADSPDPIAWPNADSKVTVLSTDKTGVRSTELDPRTGSFGYDVMVQVRVEYVYKGVAVSKTGWIKSSLLSTTKETNLLEEKSEVAAKPTPPPVPPKKNCPPRIPPEQHVEKMKTAMVQQLDVQTEMLKKVAGSCPLEHPDVKDPNKGLPLNGNMYDRFVLPRTIERDRPFLDLHLEKVHADGRAEPATNKDFMDIDALARTLYSEMNGCFESGIQYPMAVARVALNRADQGGTNFEGLGPQFLHEESQVRKPLLTEALAADKQFSVWNPPSERGKKDLTLLMSLCPETTKGNKLNWAAKKAPQGDVDIWNQALSIAAMAVLHRDDFMKLTKEVTQTDYNSIRPGEKPVAPPGFKTPAKSIHIGGRSMNNPQCLQLWDRK